MSTLAITITQPEILQLSKALQKVALEAGYNNRNTTTLTFDNAPATGTVSAVATSGTKVTV